MAPLGGFGTGFGGFWGGATSGEILPPEFDLYCFQHCLTMLGILTSPFVTTDGAGGCFNSNPITCDLEITSGTVSLDDARLTVTTPVPADYTIQWTVRFDNLPPNFLNLVDEHILFMVTDASGPCVALMVSQIGLMYLGGVHHVAGNMVVDSTTQLLPGSAAYIAAGVLLTFRMAVSAATGAVYLYVTPAADVPISGHVLRAILPVIDHASLAFPPTDRTLISVRGTLVNPSAISLDQLCLGSTVLIPNVRPVADAGIDQSLRLCSIAKLDGSASYDPEGAPVTYYWRLVDAPPTSAFVIEGHDGLTQPSGTGFVDRFYSATLGLIHATDPITVFDVLSWQGAYRTISATGTDGFGFYLEFDVADLPENLSTQNFKVLRQRGISGPTTVAPAFLPDVLGLYKFDLTVFDGALYSDEAYVVLNVAASALPKGCTPDLQFIFGYLSDFWNLVDDREVISTFWSGVAQTAATELFTLWQIEYNKSLRDIQRSFVRRWLHYDLMLPEPLPELTYVDVVWGAVTTEAMAAAGEAGISGTTLVITSPVLADPITLTFLAADPWTASQLATFIQAQLQYYDARFTTVMFADSAGNAYCRIVAPFLFTVDAASTIPVSILPRDQNVTPSGSGTGIGASDYKVDRSLVGMLIEPDDYFVLDGVAYQVQEIVTDAGDDFPSQRVRLKTPFSTAPATTWSFASKAVSRFLDFWGGMVSAGDTLTFESFQTDANISPTARIDQLIATTVLGVCEQHPDEVAIDATNIMSAVSADSTSIHIAKVLRYTYLPISDLVVEIPYLSERIQVQTLTEEETVLHQNVDYFIETYRGKPCLRFVVGSVYSVWEGDAPPERLWAEYTYLDNRLAVEANFGTLAGFTLDDLSTISSEVDYLSAVRGLFYAFLYGPTMENLRTGIQIFLGLPYAEEACTVEEIRSDFSSVRGRILLRDKARPEIIRSCTYPRVLSLETNPTTGQPYAAGDAVAQFAPLVRGVEVQDYISDPDWFERLIRQGLFYEPEKFFRFIVRVDSAAFSLSALTLARSFVYRIKPVYTLPLFIVTKALDSEISVTDTRATRVGLRLTETLCALWKGGATIFDDPNPAGGGIRSQFDADADPLNPPPVFPVPDADIRWAYDKLTLCPLDRVALMKMVTYPAPAPAGGQFPPASGVNILYRFEQPGPVAIPPGGLLPPATTPITVVAALPPGNMITWAHVRVNGDPGLDTDTFSLIITKNGIDQLTRTFTVDTHCVNVVFLCRVLVNAGDIIGCRIEAGVMPTVTNWRHLFVDLHHVTGTSWAGVMGSACWYKEYIYT